MPYQVLFHFFAPSGEEPRLVEISGVVKATYLETLSQALTKAYGTPSVDEPLNSMGQAHQEWRDGDNSVVLLATGNVIAANLSYLNRPAYEAMRQVMAPVEQRKAEEQEQKRRDEAAARQKEIDDRLAAREAANRKSEADRAEKAAYGTERQRRWDDHEKEIPADPVKQGMVGIALDVHTNAITRISPGSNFEQNGCSIGDIITAVDGFPLDHYMYIERALTGQPGTTVNVSMQHGTETKEYTVTRHLFNRTGRAD
jgi:predicted metalloprotease with PDZ domain